MQVNPKEVSGPKANTSANSRTRPTMASQRLDLSTNCDICGKHRGTRKHAKCSRIRQQLKQTEWAAFMAERAAKRQGGRRHAR